jgi:inorganic pyrophosphatase
LSKNGNKPDRLASPADLSPLTAKKKRIVRVVIETPKGSRNKYSFNPSDGIFELKKVLPAGMTFPYDFGFVPSTLADDGDPIDVLVLMDEPAFAGCVLKARLIGVIEGEQSGHKGKARNDRLVAIEEQNHSFASVRNIDDLGKQFLRELEDFFVNYHELSGERYRVIDVKGPAHALKLIARGKSAAKQHS